MTVIDTPAARVKKRRNPAVPLPPVPPKIDRRSQLAALTIDIDGLKVPIGAHVEGDPENQAAYDGTETWTIDVRDPLAELQALLPDEDFLLNVGVWIEIGPYIYYLQSIDVDEDTGTLVELVFEDQVSWRLKKFSKFLSISRKTHTRAQAALKLVQEASRTPYPVMSYYIPELTDRQQIAPIANTGSISITKGTGADTTSYTVKGARATASQRAVIDKILTACAEEGASTRVQIATIMCATQESSMSQSAANGDHIGPFQQSPTWGTLAERTDASTATVAFLNAWKAKHGSVTSAPGALAQDIEDVQASGQGQLYARWQDEATATVSAWTDGGGSVTVDVTTTTVQPYEFTRGSKTDGTVESSWTCTQRWAQEVNWRRWAQYNTFFFIDDNELRASAVDLEIWGDEDFLLCPPGFSWNPAQPVTEVTLKVLSERFAFGVGANVYFHQPSIEGRFLVSSIDGYMVSPEMTVTLRRPINSTREPAPDTTTSSATTTLTGGSSPVDRLLAACEKINAQQRAYPPGDVGVTGHGVPFTQITAHMPLDCSASVSYALWMAGMFDHPEAWTSGMFGGWGAEGAGSDFTVYWLDGHVWIQFNQPGCPYARFDTSPHGDGPDGPRLRTRPRNDQYRFTPQHWNGN